MFVLCSEITVGSISFKSVHHVAIKRSLYNLAATAVIQVPVTAVLKQSGEAPAHIETAQAISIGDKVEIKLGYDKTLNTEFVGYVKRLNYKAPLEIECEDEYYTLRYVNSVFSKKETSLKACLQELLTGVSFGNVVDLTLKNFVVNNKSAAWVLSHLKKTYGLVAYFDIAGKLHVGKANDVKGEKVTYKLRENVINDAALKYQLAKDVKLAIKAICYYKDGNKIESTVGASGGEQRTMYYYDVKDAAQLKTLAQETLKRYAFDGYRGRIETFLLPHALPSMVAHIEDSVYNERSGDYFIETVEVQFGTQGGRRIVEIGIKA